MKVCIIVVLYQPDEGCSDRWLRLFSQTGIELILVDNSPGKIPGEHYQSGCTMITLGENTGIAAAQNIGLDKSKQLGAEVVVFFDQDTQLKDAQVDQLFVLAEQSVREKQVMAPVFLDARYGFEYPSIRLNAWGLRKRIYARQAGHPIHTDLVISSGTIAPWDVLEQVGWLDERLFIDYVDTEWCLRCRKAGIPIVVNPSWLMQHTIGEQFIDLKVFRVPVHKPARRFYRIRNSFWLLSYAHVPKLLAAREVMSALLHQVIIVMLSGQRKAQTLTLFRAVRAGAAGLLKKRR